MEKILTLALLTLGLSACAVLQRSEQSGYAHENEGLEAYNSIDDFYKSRRQLEWTEARAELGYPEGKTLNEMEANAVLARVELRRLESKLTYESEKRQYYAYKPYFRNDYERIQFLRIPTREARERFARQKGLRSEEMDFDRMTMQLIEANDVGRGMSPNAVKQSWGEPDFIETAGNPIYGNERWIYNKLVSTQDGYRQEKRIIYFESGRVAGWETY